LLSCGAFPLLLLPLAACGGGGGGNTLPDGPPEPVLTAPPPPATTPPPPPPPPAVSVEIPEASSWEYTRSWLNHDTNVYSAWQSGATGEGVTVAVIDSGIDLDHPDLSVNISPLSTDINTERNNPEGTSMHGTRVASIIAAPLQRDGHRRHRL